MAAADGDGNMGARYPYWQHAGVLVPALSGLEDEALLARLRKQRSAQIELVVDEAWRDPAQIEAVMAGSFDFDGETHRLLDPIDWLHHPGTDPAWQARLHQAAYLPGLVQAWQGSGRDRFIQRWQILVEGWMAQVPPGFMGGAVTARRVQNWVYSLHTLLADPVLQAPLQAGLVRRMLGSLHTQVEHLCQELLAGRSPRTRELFAIYLAGLAFPELVQAPRWRALALREAALDVEAALLPDGVHASLSTEQHHLALRHWLQLRELATRHGDAVPPAMDQALQRALHFSMHVHKPDGLVPSLSGGDVRSFQHLLIQGAALYQCPDMAWVASGGLQGKRPADTLVSFLDSGYSVWRSGWGSARRGLADAAYLVFDCGPPGEGEHAHLDALSFELAAHGRSLLVDPGRYTDSEAGPVNWRLHFAGTAAHNTVGVDGQQQTAYLPEPVAEGPGPQAPAVRHRVAGPAAQAELCEAMRAGPLALLHGRVLSAQYDAVHERAIVCLGDGLWVLADWLRAQRLHSYEQHLQLGPQAQGQTRLRAPDGPHGSWRLDSPGLSLLQPPQAGLRVQVESGWVASHYGHKAAAPQWHARLRACDADFNTVLMAWPGEQPPPISVQVLAAQALAGESVAGEPAEPGGRPVEAPVLRIRVGQGSTLRIHTWFHGRGHAAENWAWRQQLGAGTADETAPLDYRFAGRWLHLCHDGQGQLLRAEAAPGAQLQIGGRPITLTEASPGARVGGAPRGA